MSPGRCWSIRFSHKPKNLETLQKRTFTAGDLGSESQLRYQPVPQGAKVRVSQTSRQAHDWIRLCRSGTTRINIPQISNWPVPSSWRILFLWSRSGLRCHSKKVRGLIFWWPGTGAFAIKAQVKEIITGSIKHICKHICKHYFDPSIMSESAPHKHPTRIGGKSEWSAFQFISESFP